jgi:hypothetical protein
MLFDRHFGQVRSLSSSRSTVSWYWWPQAMQRKVSTLDVVVMPSLPAAWGPFHSIETSTTVLLSARADVFFGFSLSASRA